MQPEIKTKAAGMGNAKRIEVQTEKGHWQREETIKLQPAFVPDRNSSVFNKAMFTNRGVPFSPLND